MNTPYTETEKLRQLIEEMNRSIKNLALQAASHGIVDEHVNFWLTTTDFETLPVDEALEKVKKINESHTKEWSFLNIG